MENLTVGKLFTELGLYKELPIKSDKINTAVINLVNYEHNFIDLYCKDCKKETIFTIDSNDFSSRRYSGYGYYSDNSIADSETDPLGFVMDLAKNNIYFTVTFICGRNVGHKYSLQFRIEGDKIMKIGQYPSIADLEKHDIDKYKKTLKDDYVNLNKAIGLYSHGSGAGAYVYLRRIFENLIEDKHQDALTETDWDESLYERSKMKEKMKLLSHKLPKFIMETPHLYGILSKGIHELSEDECLEYFPITQSAIELILDEKIVLLEKENKRNKLKLSLDNIASTISK